MTDQEHRPSLPLALGLAMAVAALIVFLVPRIAACAEARSRYATPPAVSSTCESGVRPYPSSPRGAK